MKHILYILLAFTLGNVFAQEQDKAALLALKKANNYVYEGNNLVEDEDFVAGEMAYRKAISNQSNTIAGIYNLGNAYYNNGNLDEALYRLEQAAKVATLKSEKHKAFHNIGNILMQNKKCKEAVEAYKNALRNNPSDHETRYNLGVAKQCAEQQEKDQQDQNKDDQNKDNKDQNKDQDKKEDDKNKDKENKDGDKDDKKDKKDEGDKDKKEGDDKKDDQGKPKDEKDKQGEGKDKEEDQQPPKPQQGRMSPQQIKNLLEAMNNQEQKVQEKMNAEKQKGVKIKSDKDW